MATKEIKQRIVLEGEKQYSAALKEAGRNLKTLKSELKAETAELGANATAQQKNEVRTKSLKKQIAEQEKIVQTLKTALEEVKEKYGDNADEVAKWEQKLNNARTTLGNMKNDLEGLGGAFERSKDSAALTAVATKSIGDALGNLGSVGENISSALEGVFGAMIDAATEAAMALWDLISQTAAKANNWTDIAGYWNTDPQKIQMYARAVSASANSFDDLQSAVSKIVLGGKTKEITELLGVSDVNYKDQWDYAMAVMDQLSLMSARGENMTPIYEQIFGEKKSTKVMDLVNDWNLIQGMLGQFNGDQSGYGMTSEQLETMNDLEVAISTVMAKWDALKDRFAAGFGEATMSLLVHVEGVMDGIADYFNAKTDGEREDALKKIRENVEGFFTKLGDIIRDAISILRQVGEDLQKSDDPITSAVGTLFIDLSNALEWIVNNADKVKTAFITIFGVMVLGKVAALAGKLAEVVASIKTIQAFNMFGSGAAAGASAGGAAAGGAAAAQTGTATVLGGLLRKALPAAVGFALPFVDSLNNHGSNDIIDESGNLIEEMYDEGYRVNDEGDITGTWDQEDKSFEVTTDTEIQRKQRDAAEAFWDALKEQGADAWWGEESKELQKQFEFDADGLNRLVDAITELTNEENWRSREDLPDWLWTDAGLWNGQQNGITSNDLQGFRGLPGQMSAAVNSGVRTGISGIKVSLDGSTVGRLVAPYVSEYIARDIYT